MVGTFYIILMNIILFDNEVRDEFLPLTFTRPMCELRVGIDTIKEKWEKALGGQMAYITQDYLAEKFRIDYGDENYVINGSVLPSPQLLTLIRQMEFNQAYLKEDELIVAKLGEEQFEKLIHDEDIEEIEGIDIEDTQFLKINHLWDIFSVNHAAIAADFSALTEGRSSAPLSDSNLLIGPPERLFLEAGASVEGAILNTTGGPIYVGEDATIMEGSMVRGPFAMCTGSVVKMGAKIYGATTLGPVVKVGGEVNNVVFQGYSNKGHDGFLGNAVIGEWCNLGADTNNSNLKNNYAEVKMWSYPQQRFIKTGLQFCGLIMGDHSKCGINTMFNTGTVVGVGCNIFGAGFPRNYVPSFAWGGAHGYSTYRTDKAFDAFERMMARRKVDFGVEERLIMLRIFEDTAKYRPWESEGV